MVASRENQGASFFANVALTRTEYPLFFAPDVVQHETIPGGLFRSLKSLSALERESRTDNRWG
jgi:hypothetical protein